MTWIALSDHATNLFSQSGFIEGRGNKMPVGRCDEHLATGSLLLETRLSQYGVPQQLLGYQRQHPSMSSISLQVTPGGGVVLIVRQGDDVFHATLEHNPAERTEVLRITYSWDVPMRRGWLSVEQPGTSKYCTVELKDPLPLMLADIQELALNTTRRSLDRDVVYLAVSSKVEPIGPMPGLTAGTLLRTPQGFRNVWDFRRGDVVVTASGENVPVLHTVRRAVPALGGFCPVRLRAPYFGLLQDIVVAPHQRLAISGSRVEYMFGVETVLVPACHLVNGRAAVRETGQKVIHYCQLLLPEHDCIDAAGTMTESLNIGRIRRKKDLLGASLLAQLDRATLPEHSQIVAPVLRPFDAIALAEARAA